MPCSGRQSTSWQQSPSSISGWFKTETKSGAAQQESKAAVSSHPAVLDIEVAISICQVPGVYCQLPHMNSACPTPELVFPSLDMSFAFLYCKKHVVLLLLFCSPQPIFFSSQAVLNTYLYDSAQKRKWKAKPCYSGHFSVVRNRPYPYDLTG